ncbi:LacI family DNA-binding transcriptional regulator [uncultured Sulfitobacter sp.]|uniref:LacI family DNA-binding transcriptional regulator n=1 Tax=uncultured Sulfitobacter sp. TaxID=191468 RepID=UPI002614AB7D|nr:LacI family DNA-binding transcriptional regulator [uncultured Sulfitobacter sp.]
MSDKDKRNVDIFAVANAAKVSISTVSRSFNHPEKLKPETRKRIDRAVRKLGYIRNRAAQTMHGIRSGTIGLIVPTMDHAIFSELMEAFARSVEPHGFSMLVASHGYDLEKEYAVARKFLEHRVDGVALIGQDHSEETYQLLSQNQTPAISIWNYDKNSRLPCVGADNLSAGKLAASHLVEHGHRDIAMIFAPRTGNDRAKGRMDGARQTLQAAGISVPQEWILQSPYSLSAAKRDVMALLQSTRRPTALLCGNDVLALGAIYAAQTTGLSVPDDISVIGIGDFKGSAEMYPALTTIRLPAQRIGRIAGEQLSDAIINAPSEMRRINCDIALRVRDSCRPL